MEFLKHILGSRNKSKMKNNKIFFQLYNPTGMINQVMSIELAVGLSHETGRQTIVHYISNNGDKLYDFRKVPIYTPSRWHNPQREGFTDPDQFPHLSDILEWDEDLILIDEKIDNFPQQHGVIEDMLNNCYYSKESEITEKELSFAEGRQRINVHENVHIKKTLGWYSRFFYNRSKELDISLSKVKFKQEYYDLAKLIASSIGEFNGGHLRLSDHIKMFNTTQEMFENGLSKLENSTLPIVISTDEPTHKMITDNRHRFILLDQYIIDNFSKEFNQLKFRDEVIFGLICNLVMHYSDSFIGTSGSTYTGYIQRIRNQNNLQMPWEFWDAPDQSCDGPFSWNNYKLDNGRKMWWREWGESKLSL